jgi:hypothetical protein
MVTRAFAITHTNRQNSHSPALTDTQRIARSLRRAELIRRYSRGTVKRSAMAMINHYIRQASQQFSLHRHDHSRPRNELHVAM